MNYENNLRKIIFHIFKFKTTEIIEILFVHFIKDWIKWTWFSEIRHGFQNHEQKTKDGKFCFLKFDFMKFINKNSNAKDGQSFLAHGFLGDVVLWNIFWN